MVRNCLIVFKLRRLSLLPMIYCTSEHFHNGCNFLVLQRIFFNRVWFLLKNPKKFAKIWIVNKRLPYHQKSIVSVFKVCRLKPIFHQWWRRSPSQEVLRCYNWHFEPCQPATSNSNSTQDWVKESVLRGRDYLWFKVKVWGPSSKVVWAEQQQLRRKWPL